MDWLTLFAIDQTTSMTDAEDQNASDIKVMSAITLKFVFAKIY